MRIQHPAKYSDVLIPFFSKLLSNKKRILDPFAGVGKIRLVKTTGSIFTNELEPEWARAGQASTIGNALYLPFKSDVFDAICTSPTYGNRMADHHNARDNSRRNTYRHLLGRPLHSANSGQLQWGEKYKQFHELVWIECKRVLKRDGVFILNISDHIRKGKRIYVSGWHLNFLKGLGFSLIKRYEIETKRQRFGANSNLRVPCEYIFVLEYTNSY